MMKFLKNCQDKKSINAFIRFLKNNDCFASYIKNCNNVDSKGFKGLKVIKTEKPYNWIQHGFLWTKTQEGYDFWSKQHTLWYKKYYFKDF